MSQVDLFSGARNGQTISLHGYGELIFFPQWLSSEEASCLFATFRDGLAWDQPDIRVYGVDTKIPRFQAWYGDPGASMQYSGRRFEPISWHPKLFELRQRLDALCVSEFNSVLANLYRDGDDSVGWHADDEVELGEAPTIASVSLGEEREFCLRPKSGRLPNAKCKTVKLPLRHGDLLVMKDSTQRFWHHAVLKEKRRLGERINLTFRTIRPHA